MADWPFELVPAPAPGTKTQGHVVWGDPVLTGWDWPYVAVHGAKPGPAVLVTAGIHGSEYASIDAVARLGTTLDPKILHGQILCLPLMNPAAFWERTAYVSPVDDLNLNRVFPGKPKGSFSERLAHLLVEKAMRHADAYLDMHGGDLPEALVPFTIYEETGEPILDARSRAMADAFGAPALLVQRATNAPISGAAFATAARLGIPAIIAEDGGAGVFNTQASDRMLSGAENVLRALGVLPDGARTMPPSRQFGRFVWIRSQQAGFFKPRVQVGDKVVTGVTLGTIHDFFGRTMEEITTDEGGEILFLVISAAIAKAGLICGIGVPD
jgi:predicted deacylase